MSSDGCSARQSMYSANCSPLTKPSVTSIGWPASVRRLSSTRSRIASWSSSGMPSSIPITRIGICAPRSATKSKPPVPTSGSRLSAQSSRILRLERRHLPRREHPRQQAAVDGVGRRVLEDDDAGRHLDVGLDELEDAAPSGDERVAVDERRARRPRSGSPRRSRAARCSRAAPPRGAGGTSGTGRRRSRRRTGRSTRRSRWSWSSRSPGLNSCQHGDTNPCGAQGAASTHQTWYASRVSTTTPAAEVEPPIAGTSCAGGGGHPPRRRSGPGAVRRRGGAAAAGARLERARRQEGGVGACRRSCASTRT